ncbi:collagen alpha-1(I) chain-like [Mustela erminea]|uniref:collagen alpha-1(I) chain-like n=1 Tax=Mustela erminea TaxID=36723 RepID=UPI0013872021|nr:collagen alpha-1(I) chain-like [Mustela erminea]
MGQREVARAEREGRLTAARAAVGGRAGQDGGSRSAHEGLGTERVGARRAGAGPSGARGGRGTNGHWGTAGWRGTTAHEGRGLARVPAVRAAAWDGGGTGRERRAGAGPSGARGGRGTERAPGGCGLAGDHGARGQRAGAGPSGARGSVGRRGYGEGAAGWRGNQGFRRERVGARVGTHCRSEAAGGARIAPKSFLQLLGCTRVERLGSPSVRRARVMKASEPGAEDAGETRAQQPSSPGRTSALPAWALALTVCLQPLTAGLPRPGLHTTKLLRVCAKNTLSWKNGKAPCPCGNFVLYKVAICLS